MGKQGSKTLKLDKNMLVDYLHMKYDIQSVQELADKQVGEIEKWLKKAEKDVKELEGYKKFEKTLKDTGDNNEN